MRTLTFASLLFVLISSSSAQAQDQGDANILFATALETYERALVASDPEQRELLRQVNDLLTQIREEHPESIPAQFMAEGRTLGGIDLALVETATEDLPIDRLDAATKQRLESLVQSICGSEDSDCRSALLSATSEFLVRVMFEDMEGLSDQELLRWLFSNPGRFDDNLARVTTFSEALENEAFVLQLTERLDQKLLGDFAQEALSDLALGIIIGLTSDVLADYYENQDQSEAAAFTRTWMEPLVETSVLLLTSNSATIGTAYAGAAVIWAQNAYGFVNLGAQQLTAELSGATQAQQLEEIGSRISSLTQTLLTGRVTGPMFAQGDQGTVVTARMARAFEADLAALYELQTYWLSSNDAILLDTFDFLLVAARNSYQSLQALAPATQPSGTEHANSTDALPADREPNPDVSAETEAPLIFGVPNIRPTTTSDQISAFSELQNGLYGRSPESCLLDPADLGEEWGGPVTV